jgi:hypothetical protein
MERYILTEISSDKADEIIEGSPDIWDYICENKNGVCYWNKQTGELLWIPHEEDIAKFSKINTLARKIKC